MARTRRRRSSRSCFAATWRGTPGHRRHPLRAARLRAGRARAHRPLQRRSRDPNTLYLADGLLLGRQLRCAVRSRRGARFPRARSWTCATSRAPGASGRSSPRASQAPPDVSYAIVPCDRPTSAGFNDPTLTRAGVPLATTLPGDGIHYERFILAAPGGPGLAPAPSSEALRVRATVHGEPAPVTVTGRVVAGGTADRRRARDGPRRCCSTSRRSAPTPTIRRGARRGARRCRSATGASRSRCPPNRRLSRAAVRVRAAGRRPTTSFAVDDALSVDIGDITMPRVRAPHRRPSRPRPASESGPVTYAELVLVPVERRRATDAPSFYGLFPGCNPMLGPPHGGSPGVQPRADRRTGASIC